MANYGFRIYDLQLRPGRAYTPMAWQTPQGDHYLPTFEHSAHALISRQRPDCQQGSGDSDILDAELTYKGYVDGKSPYLPDPLPEKACGLTVSTVALSAGQRRLSLEMTYGKAGTIEAMMRANGTTKLLGELPARTHRVEILAPDSTGQGLLIVESISRSAPLPPMVRHLNMVGLSGSPAQRQLYMGEQLTDTQYLHDLLAGSVKTRVQLKAVATAANGNPDGDTYDIDANVVSPSAKGELLKWVLSPSRTLKGMTEGVLKVDLGSLDVNDASVSVTSAEGVTTRIDLDSVRDYFTYPISYDIKPDPATWEKAVRERVAILAPHLTWA